MGNAPSTSRQPTRVVILGAGFGGFYTAFHLDKLARRDGQVEIVLVSEDNYFLLTPFLFEAGSGVLEPRHAVKPVRLMLRKARFVEAGVDRIDFEHKVVHSHHPASDVAYALGYDHLVIALGGVTNRAIIPGSERALAFKRLADAIYLRNHLIDLFEQADVEQDPQRKKDLLTIVIIGAGLVGVELAGELTEFIPNLARAYPNVVPADVTIHLIEAGPNVLPEMERDLADYAVATLRKRRVYVDAGTPVKRIEPGKAHLADGRVLSGQTLILTAGVAVNPLLADFPLAKDRKGRIAVDATMRSASHAGVWALGDCANIPGPDGKPYPQLAQHALRQAKVLAGNIWAVLHGESPQPFVYKMLGTLASLGHYRGVGRIMNLRVRGFVAWWIWRTYYLFQMPRFERKLRIILDWTVALFFRNDVVKLDLFGHPHPSRAKAVEEKL